MNALKITSCNLHYISQFNDPSEIPAILSSTNFTQVSIDMTSHARMSRDLAIEKWRQILHRVRVCYKCPDCATCVEDQSANVSAAASLSQVTSISTYQSPSSSAASSQSSQSPSSPPVMFVACQSFDKRDRWGDIILVMDERCYSHVTRHMPHKTRNLSWFREECNKKQPEHVVEVHLPTDPEAQWKVRSV